MRVLFCGLGWFDLMRRIEERLPDGFTIAARDPDEPLVDQLRDVNVILPSNANIDAAEVEAPRELVLIQQPAVGYQVDLDAARRRGVPVCNAPGVNADAVAETAILLMLALARRLPQALQALREARLGEPTGNELHGKTLGIVGRGAIGGRVADIAATMGMRVLSVRSGSPPGQWDELLRESDYVSLHCPLTPETRGLLSREAFGRMKPGVRIVNGSRAPIVDREALEEALDDGRVAGIGLDAHWTEPWDPDDPLYRRDEVVALPHIGGSTVEAFERTVDIVVENLRRVARGEDPAHRVA